MNLIKTSLMFCTVVLAGLTLQQKSVNCLVWEDPSAVLSASKDDDRKISSLIVEYFKSELATHSGIKVTLPATAADAVQNAKLVRGKGITPAQVKIICKDSKSNIFCAVSLKNRKVNSIRSNVQPGKSAVAVIFDGDGKVVGRVAVPYNDVKKADAVCEKLAEKAAALIQKNQKIADNDTALKSVIIPRKQTVDTENVEAVEVKAEEVKTEKTDAEAK